VATKKKTAAGVNSFEEARDALRQMRLLNLRVKSLMEEHGITDLQEEAAELKKAATEWAVKSDTERIDLGKGIYARLRRDKYGGTWVATDEDLEGAPASAVPLYEILRLKFPKKPQSLKRLWASVTKVSVDPEELQRAVLEGHLTADEIAPAYWEKEKSPFLIIYGD
jgi:hypothetical protein